MNVPLIDIVIRDAGQRREIDDAIRHILDKGAYIGGEEVAKFNDEFGAYCGGTCVSVANGTDALILALKALGIGPGDEVVTVPFTFIATAEAITAVGAKIRFVDIEPVTYALDPARLADAITPKTKAIIAVHLFGHPADMDALKKVCAPQSIKIVEDAAQAHGATYKGKRTGSLGDIACFSFYPTKNLGGFGDGGAVVATDQRLIDLVTKIANHGRSSQYFHDIAGLNSRLDAVQAVYLRSQLKRLEDFNRRRVSIAKRYEAALKNHPLIKPPVTSPDASHVFHLYCVRSSKRDALAALLKEKGIGHGVYYPLSLHLQPAYKHLGYKKGDFPVSEQASETILALPMHPHLTDQQVQTVCDTLISFKG